MRDTITYPLRLRAGPVVPAVGNGGELPAGAWRESFPDLVVDALNVAEEQIATGWEYVGGSPEGQMPARAQQLPCPPVLHRRVDPVPGRSSEHQVEGGCSRRLPRLEGRFDDFHIREPGEILPAYGSQVGPDLHARDLKPPPGKRNRGFPSGTSDLRKPVASALVFRLNDGSVTVTNVASFTARYPARAADELGALQTAPGYDDVTGLGTPTSSFLAALSGK